MSENHLEENDVVLYFRITEDQFFLDYKLHPKVQPSKTLEELLLREGLRVECVTEIAGKTEDRFPFFFFFLQG